MLEEISIQVSAALCQNIPTVLFSLKIPYTGLTGRLGRVSDNNLGIIFAISGPDPGFIEQGFKCTKG